MQIYNFGSWRELLIGILGWIISGLLIIALAVAALWLIKRFVGEANFPALTLLVAIVGAVVAVTQTSTTANQQKADQARDVAFANGLARDAIQLLTRPVPKDHQGEISEPFTLSQQLAFDRSSTLQQMMVAADQIDLSKLPSAISMAGVVKLRANLHLAFTRMQARLQAGKAVDMDDSVGDLILVSQDLGQERDRLYPIYQIGDSIWLKDLGSP